MKQGLPKLTYYLILWLITSIVYSATTYFYLGLTLNASLLDGAIFSVLMLSVGLSMFFAIRYMDIGIRSLGERFLAHSLTSTISVLALIYISKGIFNRNYYDFGVQWDEIIMVKPFFGYIIYILIVLVFYLIKYQDYQEEKNSREKELEDLLTDTELNLLKLQLNPHFLFNSLNSINSLTITNPNMAREMIVKLSEFLRYSLGSRAEKNILLRDELDNVKLYLDIEKVRFGDKLNIKYHIDPETLSIELPNMILQPLFENAVKFSLNNTEKNNPIEFRSSKKNNLFSIAIINSFDPKDNSIKGKGIGLQNVARRLKLHFGSNSKITKRIDDTLFEIKIEVLLV